jgi:putative spermidine/putrescine transport system substrate-binding protein
MAYRSVGGRGVGVTTWALCLAAFAIVLSGIASPPVRAQQKIVLGSYGGTIEQFMRNVAIPAFEKETGIQVVYVTGTALSNYSKVLATRSNPEMDIYWSNDLTHLGGKLQGLYEKLDPSIVTNLKDVLESLRDPDGIGVPSHISTTGLQYNSKIFKERGWNPPTSWFDLWDPKFKGKVALYSIGVLYSQEFLGTMTRVLGGSEKNIGPAIKKIKELRDTNGIVAFPTSPADMDNVMVQEQAWITVNASIRTLALKERGSVLEYVDPKEGGVLFSVYFDVVKGSRNPVGAQRFINHMLSADMQTKAAAGLGYAPVNTKATIPEKWAKYMPTAKTIHSFVKLDREVENRNLDEWIETWNREIEAKR